MKKLFLFCISFFLLFSIKTNNDIFIRYSQAIGDATVIERLKTLEFYIRLGVERNSINKLQAAALKTLLYNKMESLQLARKTDPARRCKSSCS